MGMMTILISLATALAASREAIPRDYKTVQARIIDVHRAERTLVAMATRRGQEFPLYALVIPPLSHNDGRTRQNILLSGGVHGDEPAGVYALLHFLEHSVGKYTDQYRFFVLPCVNPTGFTFNDPSNASGANVNRSFAAGSQVLEAAAIMKQLEKWNVRFRFTMDLHEIPPYWEGEGWTKKDNPHSAYLYETQTDHKLRIGRKMIAALPKSIAVCHWPTIYGDKAVGGLVSYPEGCQNAVYAAGTTFDGYLHGRYTDHTFTSETPIGWSLRKRIRTHLTWLEKALKLTSQN